MTVAGAAGTDFGRWRGAILAALVLVPLFWLLLYLQPGGVASASAEANPPAQAPAGDGDALLRRLREHLQQQPRDARGWVILARLLAERDQFPQAAEAYVKALALPSKVARDPAVWCEYADALGMQQGGSLAGKPRELIDRALALSPNHPKALEMAGSSEYERRDYAAALGFWQPLLASHRPGTQAYTELAAAIARTERLAATSLPPQRH